MTRKGDIHAYEGGGFYSVASGAYFDWPWWRRRLSDAADWLLPTPLSWLMYGLFRWRVEPEWRWGARKTLLSIYSSKVKPIYWRVHFGTPPEPAEHQEPS